MVGLGLGVRSRRLGAFHPAAVTWFEQVEAAGSTFVAEAKPAYSKFFTSEIANGNLAAFDNGMVLFFPGYAGLGGCFRPPRSRGGALPVNLGFVAGNKATNWLQGTGSAYINCTIGALPSQTNNFCFGVYGLTQASVAMADLGNNNAFPAGVVQMLDRPVENDVLVRASSSSPDNATPRNLGFRLFNRTQNSQVIYYHQTGQVTISRAAQDIDSANMSFFARGISGLVSDRRLAMTFWGNGLPEPAAFSTAVKTLMSDLGIVL